MPDNLTPEELVDGFIDDLLSDANSPSPAALEPASAELSRSLLALAQELPSSYPDIQTRIWRRIEEQTQLIGQPAQPSVALNGGSQDGPARDKPFTLAPATDAVRHPQAAPDGRETTRFRLKANGQSLYASSRPWLARAAAILIVLALLGAGIGTSGTVLAQIRRLGCLVPTFGIQDCEAPALVAAQAVSLTQGDLTVNVVYFVSTVKQTSLRMELRGLADDTSSGELPQNRPELTLQQIIDLETTRLDLRTDRGQTLTSDVSDARPDPRMPPGVVRFTSVRAAHAIDDSPTSRLSVFADWTFPPLDPQVRAVDVAASRPAHVWSLHVPVVSVEQAGFRVASGKGLPVAHDGVTMWVDGVSEQADGGLLVQVAARPGPEQSVAGIGGVGFNEDPNFRRALWDSNGQQYRDTNKRCCPMTDRTEGDTFYQQLTFQGVPVGTRLQFLELPFVQVRQNLRPASFTVPLAGHSAGERMSLNSSMVLGADSLEVLAATLEDHGTDAQGRLQRSLLVEFDFGDWPDGRRLGMPLEMSLDGQSLDPRAVEYVMPGPSSAITLPRYRTLRLPLPLDVGPQLTVTVSSPGVTIRGPWMLPMPSTSHQ